MQGPMIVSTVFVLSVVVLCFWKPEAGRIFLGVFFLVMALGVNGYFTFSNPRSYLDYADGALIPFYRSLAVSVVRINPFLFGLLLMAFEIAMGLLILHKKQSVKLGLFGTMLFLVGIAPLDWVQLPWLGLLAAQAKLLTVDFEHSVLEKLGEKFGLNKSRPA